MKQHITDKQYQELSDKIKIIWLAWAKDKGYGVLVNPSIGQMIEFLDEHGHLELQRKDGLEENYWYVLFEQSLIDKNEVCDALWEAVKDIL